MKTIQIKRIDFDNTFELLEYALHEKGNGIFVRKEGESFINLYGTEHIFPPTPYKFIKKIRQLNKELDSKFILIRGSAEGW